MDEIRHASRTQIRAHFHLINSKDRINDAFSKFLATKQTPKNIVTVQFIGRLHPKEIRDGKNLVALHRDVL